MKGSLADSKSTENYILYILKRECGLLKNIQVSSDSNLKYLGFLGSDAYINLIESELYDSLQTRSVEDIVSFYQNQLSLNNKLFKYRDKATNENDIVLYAARYGDLKGLKLLKENGWDLEVKGSCNDTSLHEAAKRGRLDCLKYLVNIFKDLNPLNVNSKSPLFYAAEIGDLECMKLLIKSGCSPNVGANPSILGILTAKKNHKECLLLLIESGCDVTRDYDGKNPIHAAAETGNVEIMKILKEQGCDLNQAEGCSWWTPAHFAAFHGNYECLVLLNNWGCSLD
jgi:ankyrin repeat protein